jgi:MFS family permease
LATALFATALINELASGVAFNASPELTAAFDLSPLLAAGLTLVAIQLLGVVLEVPLMTMGDRWPRRPMIALGLLAMAVSCALPALVPTYWAVLLSLVLYGPAAGVGVELAQATLVDADPKRAETMLARWTLLGALGDIGTPAVLAAVVAVGFSYRAAFAICAVAVLWNAWAVWRGPDVPRVHVEEEERGTLRDAIRNRRLVLWELACVFCAFLDELMVAFGALHLHMPPAQRAVVFIAWMLGSIAGASLAERLLARRSSRQLLIATSIACAPALGLWLWADTLWLSAVALSLVGFFAAPMYPIAKAQAYDAMPGSSGAVAALGALLQPVEMLFPIAVGFAANAFGVTPALTLLFLQPLGLLLLAVYGYRRRSAPSPP